MRIHAESCKPVHGGEGVKITFRLSSGGENTDEGSEGALIVSFEDYAEFSEQLRAGEISEELFSVLEERSRFYAAYSRGVYLLSYGDCNRRRMIEKLVVRGCDRESAEYASDRLCREGLIDEFTQIREKMIAMCREKHYGRRRILSELYGKGYRREDIQQAFSLFEGELDYDEARAALLTRVFGTTEPDLSDPKMRQKYLRTLYQYGF